MSVKYANAVAAVKAMENTLLTRSDIDQMISARTRAEAEAIASAKTSGNDSLEKVWEMLSSYAPDDRELRILLYRNDFHDLKAVLKATIANRDPSVYYISPANVSLEELTRAVSTKEFDILPAHLAEPAEEAYELLTRTLDGQLSDSLIDAAALKAMQDDAEKYGGEFMKSFAALTTVCADIKTAYRCSRNGKNAGFIETAVCGSREIDKLSLVRAAQTGTESLLSFLDTTPYGEAAALLRESPARFEKWCDDKIMELAETARLQAFGIEPLAAYYIAKEAELKNLRILGVCRECGSDRETIEERMRKLYV